MTDNVELYPGSGIRESEEIVKAAKASAAKAEKERRVNAAAELLMKHQAEEQAAKKQQAQELYKDKDLGNEPEEKLSEKEIIEKQLSNTESTLEQDRELIEEARNIDLTTGSKEAQEIKRAFNKIVSHARGVVYDYQDNGSIKISVSAQEKHGFGHLNVQKEIKRLEAIVKDIDEKTADRDPDKRWTNLEEVRNYTKKILSDDTSIDKTTLKPGENPKDELTNFLSYSFSDVLYRNDISAESAEGKEIKCLEDFIGLIMLQAPARFRRGREFQLMDTEGKIQFHNVALLLYDQVYEQVDLNDNGKIEAYNSLAYFTLYRQVTLGEGIMNTLRTYFRKRGQVISEGVDPRTGRKVKEYEYEESSAYLNFYEYLLVFLSTSNNIHNPHIAYTNNMELSGENFAKMYGELFGPNENIYTSRWLRYMGLPLPTQEEMNAFIYQPDRKKSMHEFVGNGGLMYQRSLKALQYLPALTHVKAELTKDNNFIKTFSEVGYNAVTGKEELILNQEAVHTFFKQLVISSFTDKENPLASRLSLEDSRKFDALIKELKDDKHTDIFQVLRENQSGIFDFLTTTGITKVKTGTDKEGKDILMDLKGELAKLLALPHTVDTEAKVAFLLAGSVTGLTREQFNMYTQTNKKTPIEARVVIDSLKAAMTVQYKDKITTGDKREERAFMIAQNTVQAAYETSYWSGIAARNDVDFGSHNTLTTIVWLQNYLHKNRGKTATGDPEDLMIMMGALTPIEALWVTAGKVNSAGQVKQNGMSLTEYMDTCLGFSKQHARSEIIHDNSTVDKNDRTYRRVGYEFINSSMSHYANWHLKGAMEMMDFIRTGHGLDLGSLVQRDAYGRLVTHKPADLDKKLQKVIGAARNMIAKPEAGVQADAMINVLTTDDGKNFYYADKQIKEILFSENVLHMDVNHGAGAQGESKGEQVARQIIGWLVAADIRRHRGPLWGKNTSLEDRWTAEEINWLKRLFELYAFKVEKEKKKVLEDYTDENGKRRSRIVEIELDERSEGYFTEYDWDNIASKADVRNEKLIKEYVAGGGTGTILGFFTKLFSESLKAATKFK